ncbi:MAG TPA: VWA domain-containing protein, partial [Bryobacteraceae bacterium]
MRIRWPGVVAALVAACAVHAQAQQEVRVSARTYSPAPVALHVETDLVEVGVVVRSYDGHAIQGLKRENFNVSDQGHARDISYFAVETPGLKGVAPQAGTAVGTASPAAVEQASPAASAVAAPRFIVLYFEDFATNGADLKRAQMAGRRFIKEGLDDSDRVAIYSTSGDVVDYTNDKAKLIAAIDKLRPHPKYYEPGNGCPRISAYQAYLIASLQDRSAIESAKAESVKCNSADLDATYVPGQNTVGPDGGVIAAQAEVMWGQVRIASQVTLDHIGAAMRSLEKTPGRHLLLLVSAGFNSGTLEIERDRLIDLALRSGIVVNALDAKGLVAEGPGRGMNESVDNVG